MKFIIEGIDRLGKDTLAKNIQHKLGFHQIIHYTKPLTLDAYQNSSMKAGASSIAQEAYQRASFKTMFELLHTKIPLILNRAHLGECVYAPLYRGYSGDYVFELEERWNADIQLKDVRLILLVENFGTNAIQDDGLSLGPLANRIREQDMFMDAFGRSIFPDKRVIAVTNDVGYRSEQEILEEALA